MSEKKRHTIKSKKSRLDAMTDKDIDYSDIPELDESFWDAAVPVIPKAKKQITLRIDDDVIEFFKKSGSGYQSKINAVLRAYTRAHAK